MFTRKMIIGMIVAVLIWISGTALGATYYVDPNGSDDANGSPEEPFATIQKALNMCADGSDPNYIIDVNSGTYITEPLDSDVNNLKILFHSDVNVIARSILDPNSEDPKDSSDPQSFRYPRAYLFEARSDSNIIIEGNDTVFQMNKSEYPPSRRQFDVQNDVDLGSDSITIPDHGFKTGDCVQYYHGSTQSDIGGLSWCIWYYVIEVNENEVQLGKMFKDANSEPVNPIDLTSIPENATTQ